MDFTGLNIPEGEVTKIRDSGGNLLWRKETLSVTVNAVVTRNIIDNLTEGKYLNKTGAESTNNTWNISDFIPCEPGDIEVASVGSAPSMCFYDKDKNYLSGIQYLNTNPKSGVAPPKTHYCKWSVSNSATATTYIKIPFSNTTELFKASMVDKVINIQGNVVAEYVTGGSTYAGEVNGIGIPCEGKTKVNFSGFGTSAGRLLVCFYDADDKAINGTRTKPSAVSGSIAIPEGACYVRFSYYYIVGTDTKSDKAFKNFTVDVE